MKLKLKKILAFGVLLIICWICSYFYEKNNNAKVILNQKIGIGYIRKVELFDRYSRHKITFDLFTNGKLLETTWTIRDDIDFDKLQRLDKKNLVVVYDSLDVNNKVLLLTQDDFDKFNVAIPDSLIWLKQIIGE